MEWADVLTQGDARGRARVCALIDDRIKVLDVERAELLAIQDKLIPGGAAPGVVVESLADYAVKASGSPAATVLPSKRSLAQRKRWAKRKGGK